MGDSRWARLLVLLVVPVMLMTSGCATGGHDHREGDAALEHDDAGHEHPESGGDAGVVLGAPGESGESDRTVEVIASDDLSFSPEDLEVEVGETVTFVIKNEGSTKHEFVLGDAAYQEAHAGEMSSGHHDAGTGNAVELAPGETKRLTWSFTQPGEMLFGCHEPGHYDGGMVGTIEIA
ncbi:MAG TPA: plastocyanin/azurin family copper-binding protein [Actinomycetota bacterium]|nr:plastocyanin/azurin family copper-binding protein [Actinomycetota bacterium]